MAALRFLSTEDWIFTFSSPLSLAGLALRAEMRATPGGPVIADCTTENGRINLSVDGLTAIVTSFAADRDWQPIAPLSVICDLMRYDADFTPTATTAVGRQSAVIIPGVTLSGDPASTLPPPVTDIGVLNYANSGDNQIVALT